MLEDTSIDRLLVIAPPESAKSTYFSIIFPTWYIGKHREDAGALVSCTATQAQEFGGAVSRTIESSPEYREVFPDVKPDIEAGWSKDRFFVQRENRARPDATLTTTGMTGPIIGRRFNFVIVDDPTDQEIAYSEVLRQRQKTWFKQTLLSRIVDGGRCVVILTRWHEDDLAAELMKPEMGFTVAHLPAITNGHSYWPKHHGIKKLEKRKAEVGSDIFRCMYQGDPVDLSGSVFKREWFRYFTIEPEAYSFKAQVWDTALKADVKKHDFSVCMTGVVDNTHMMHLLDLVRVQLEAPDLEKLMVQQFLRHHPNIVGIEDKAAGTSSIQRLRREYKLPLRALKTENKNKLMRARVSTPYFERGEVYFRDKARWLEDLEHELLSFPMGKYDDQVDTLVYLIGELARVSPRLKVDNEGDHANALGGIRGRTF